MGTGIVMLFIVASFMVTVAATAGGVDFDTITVGVLLAGLFGMLCCVVWWDSWQPEDRCGDDALGAANPEMVAEPVPHPGFLRRVVH